MPSENVRKPKIFFDVFRGIEMEKIGLKWINILKETLRRINAYLKSKVIGIKIVGLTQFYVHILMLPHRRI